MIPPSLRKHMLHPQRLAPLHQSNQPIDIGMLAGVEAGVFAVFAVDVDALGGGFGGDGAVDLGEVVVHGQ